MLNNEQQTGLLNWMAVLKVETNFAQSALKKKWQTFEIQKLHAENCHVDIKFHYRLNKNAELEIDLVHFRKTDPTKKADMSKFYQMLGSVLP